MSSTHRFFTDVFIDDRQKNELKLKLLCNLIRIFFTDLGYMLILSQLNIQNKYHSWALLKTIEKIWGLYNTNYNTTITTGRVILSLSNCISKCKEFIVKLKKKLLGVMPHIPTLRLLQLISLLLLLLLLLL